MLVPETGIAPIASDPGRNICTLIFQRIKRVEKSAAISPDPVALHYTVPGTSVPVQLSGAVF